MKLSDVKGERVFEVLADIIDPIANIAEDEQAAALFKKAKLPEGTTPDKFLLERARKAVPPLLRGHKNDIIAILAAIEGVEPETYKGTLNMFRLFKDCTSLLSDEAFSELFISAQRTGDTSGAAQETTTEPGD